MIHFIYLIIILFATLIGPIVGVGGGVVIRPLLDIVGYHEVFSIAFYSSLAVFTMAIVSIIKQIIKGFKFELKIILTISIGSLLGGILGQRLLSLITQGMENSLVVVIQSTMLIVMLLIILLYKFNKHKIKHYKIKNLVVIFLVGLALGTIAVFLGIGGGPLNMLVFLLLFSFPIKQATVYSVTTIFFAQGSSLVSLLANGEVQNMDLSFVPIIIVSAIIGGFIGTKLNLHLDDKKIDKYFKVLMIFLILVSIFNMVTNL